MKTVKLIIGIVSIVLTFLIIFQSCAAGLGDAIADNGGTSGGSGIIVAVLMLIAGIVAIAARNSRGGSIFCAILYLIGGIVGVSSSGVFKDLIFWGVLDFIFAVVFALSVIICKKAPKTRSEQE